MNSKAGGGLNKRSGNMYEFVSHSFNPIRGECPHSCSYCFISDMAKRYRPKDKRKPQIFPGPLRLVDKILKTNLGSGKTIFVGSSTDMWAEPIPQGWIEAVMNQCRRYPDNTYLFQTKNPARFLEPFQLPPKTILATTIETNRKTLKYSEAPQPRQRMEAFKTLKDDNTIPDGPLLCESAEYMISCEPIMDFDLSLFVDMIREIKPDFVSVGADSKHHHLPEPEPLKVKLLINTLRSFTEVILKPNIKRLMGGSYVESDFKIQ